MPCYEYKCEQCGHEADEYQSMRDEPLTRCPKCGRESYTKQVSRVRGGGMVDYFKPIEMHSIAATTHEEVEEFCRKNPDIECSTDPRNPLYGVPVARNRQQKLQALKSVGYEERN